MRDPPLEGDLDTARELVAVGHEDRGGQRVVLGLADEVGGDVLRVGAVVSEDGDLGGTGLGVDADEPLEQPLGRRDVDVPGSGHEADGLADHVAVLEAVGEGGHGLGAAHGIHLVHAEQGARREDRVREAGEGAGVLPLGWAGHGERAHARLLGRDDVHDDAGGVHGEAARHVEPDTVDRHPALGHLAARDHLCRGVGASLVRVHCASPPDGLLQGGPHGRVEARECRLQRPRAARAARAAGPRRSAPRARTAPRLHDAARLADRAHRLQCRLDVELGAGQGLRSSRTPSVRPRRSIVDIMGPILGGARQAPGRGLIPRSRGGRAARGGHAAWLVPSCGLKVRSTASASPRGHRAATSTIPPRLTMAHTPTAAAGRVFWEIQPASR